MARTEKAIVTVVVGVLLVLTAVILTTYPDSVAATPSRSSLSSLRWYSCDKGSQLTDANRRLFDEHGVNYTPSAGEADVYIPCGYSYADLELSKMPQGRPWVYAVGGMDNIVAKDALWSILAETYGVSGAKALTPCTWLLYIPSDRTRFAKDLQSYPDSTLFILKKNIQRQEGLKLIPKPAGSTLQEALAAMSKEGYVVIQHFVDDPYLIKDHKINLRVYVLYICDRKGKKSAYAYRDGFVYYTKRPYRYSLDSEETITTGYSRELYKTCPLTHEDLRQHLGLLKGGWLFRGIRNNLQKTIAAVAPRLCSGQAKATTYFQLFGCDYQINKDLSVYVLEWNKGPSLTQFDPRDGSVKSKVQEDAFRLVGILPPSKGSNGFNLVWSSG